jgi:nicotinamidase-related amidase
LRKAKIETLIVAGIVTNGGVASTVRDAHVRDFEALVLSDGCAAFSDAVHEATLVSLGTIAALTTCAELQAYLGTGAG